MGSGVTPHDLGQGWMPALVLVWIHSYFRFNTPPTNRAQTTAGRYHAAAFLYSGVVLAAWGLLANYPQIIATIGGASPSPDPAKTLAAPLYAALAVTILLPNVPILKDYDGILRHWLQDLAHIPYEAMRLSAVLQASAFRPDAHIRAEVEAEMRRDGFSPSDVLFTDGDDPRALWSRVATFKHQLDQWKTSIQFGPFVYARERDIDQLNDTYSELSQRAKRLFRTLETIVVSTGNDVSREVLEDITADFKRDAKTLQRTVCNLISQGVLTCILRETRRNEALRELGFAVNVENDRMFDKLMWLFVGFTAYYVVTIVVYGQGLMLSQKTGAQILESALIGVLTATVYVAAVASAVYVRRWKVGQPRDGERPVRGYVVAAACAALLSLAGTGVTLLLVTGNIQAALQLLGGRTPWSLIALVTAFATAFNIDNPERPRMRWFEAAGQAVVGMGTIFFVHELLVDLAKCDGCHAQNLASHVPNLARLVVSAGLSGGVIG